MELARIIGIALATTFAVVILKPQRPELAAFVTLAGGTMVILMFLQGLTTVITNMTQIVEQTGINSAMFNSLLRIIGIGYLTEFAASICNDAGNSSMSAKVILAGKVLILILALPIVNNLIEIIARLL